MLQVLQDIPDSARLSVDDLRKDSDAALAVSLPRTAGWLFPEYDVASIDLDEHRGVIIERLLDRGTWDQLRWLFSTYGEGQVADWVRRHGFRLLSKRSFALWRVALGITDYQAPDWAIQARKIEGW